MKYTELYNGFNKSTNLEMCYETEYCYIVFEDTTNNECYCNVADDAQLDREK